MKTIEWNEEKNLWLQRHRGISFEEVLMEIAAGRVIGDIDSPNRSGQKVYIIVLHDYPFRVPYVEDDDKIFLKTAYPSRKDLPKLSHQRRK